MSTLRFFNYADKAPQEFKDKLNESLVAMDRSNQAVTNTPFAAAFCIALVGALQAGLSLPAPIASIAQILLASSAALIMGVSKQVKNTNYTFASNLIMQGVREGFFKQPAPIVFEAKLSAQDEITLQHEIDATKLRLLHSS